MRVQLMPVASAGKPKRRKAAFGLGRHLIMPGVLTTAVMLPGIQDAFADTVPERGYLAFKYLDYQDRQPDLERISVHAPSVMLMMPIAGEWSVEGVLTSDTVSGASPSYHSEASSAARMHDVRRGRDFRVTRYFPRGSLTIGTSLSDESDYASRAYSLTGAVSSEDKNTTLHMGVGMTRDRINPSNQVVADERKSINDFMIGVTQVLGTHDIAQLNLTHSRGRGYFSDPYKYFDNRPRHKNQTAMLARWNHHFDATDGSSRLGYRYFSDSFGIRAHTLTAEYVQPLPGGWTLTPLARLYSQSAANFYLNPVNPPDPTLPDNFQPGETIFSLDQRLSAFGARSFGMKIVNQVNRDWLIDVKYEHYRQKSEWCFNAKGSPGIAPFTARIIQVGITHFF